MTEVSTATVPPIKGDIVYSGTYGNIIWTIDKDGLLEVRGTGDMYPVNEEPGWCSYKNEIKSARLEVTGATHLEYLFAGYSLTNVDLSKLDTSKVTTMKYMFGESILTSVDVSGFNMSKSSDGSYMFGGCTKLTNIDIRNFDDAWGEDHIFAEDEES